MINLQWTSYSSSNFLSGGGIEAGMSLVQRLGKHPPSAGKDPGSPELDLRPAGVGKDKASGP